MSSTPPTSVDHPVNPDPNTAPSGVNDSPQGGDETGRQLTTRETSSDPQFPMELMTAQLKAFQDISKFMQDNIGKSTRAERSILEKLAKRSAVTFHGVSSEDPEVAENWIINTNRVLDEIKCTPEEKLVCVVSLLRDDAYRWWQSIEGSYAVEERNYEMFCRLFRRNYVGQVFMDQRRMEFIHLKQKDNSVIEYKIKFVNLSRYGMELIPNNKEKCRKFKDGLNWDIRRALLVLRTEDFNELVEAAQEAEQLFKDERSKNKKFQENKDGSFNIGNRGQKRDFNLGGNSNSKEYGGESKRRNNQPPQSIASTPSRGFTYSNCDTCGRRHQGECWKLTGACMICGSKDHQVRDCPKASQPPPAQTMSTQNQRGGKSVSNMTRGVTSAPSKGNEGRGTARTYALRGSQAVDAPEVENERTETPGNFRGRKFLKWVVVVTSRKRV